MSEIVSPIVFQLGVGGVGGLIVGYTLKKIGKLIVVLIGLFVIVLLYLSTRGIININYEALWSAVSGLVGSAGEIFSWLVGLISIMPFLGSFAVGFLLGFKLG
ncbi:MAG: FUN14 domain-containing protein [Candidatus Bathyarchaeia archaeon]